VVEQHERQQVEFQPSRWRSAGEGVVSGGGPAASGGGGPVGDSGGPGATPPPPLPPLPPGRSLSCPASPPSSSSAAPVSPPLPASASSAAPRLTAARRLGAPCRRSGLRWRLPVAPRLAVVGRAPPRSHLAAVVAPRRGHASRASLVWVEERERHNCLSSLPRRKMGSWFRCSVGERF